MKPQRGPVAASFLALALVLAVNSRMGVALAMEDFDAWVLARDSVRMIGHATETRLPVGSLQKVFVARAWARAHAGESLAAIPKHTCTRNSGCWRPSGHGALDLRAAVRDSCNAFFLMLARDTPRGFLEASMREAGFVWRGELTEEESIGLPGLSEVRIAPETLLRSYADLVRTPWQSRDDVRAELLAGMRESSETGTGAGLGLRGFLVKTGTVPALDGAPLTTSGLAVVLDDTGFAFLGLLRRGTGRLAAIRAGEEIKHLRPGALTRSASQATARAPRRAALNAKAGLRELEAPVRVEMLGELRADRLRITNAGSSPVDSSHGFIGPRATIEARHGDRFSAGVWRITIARPVFARTVRGALEVHDDSGSLRVIATVTARDYANGVIKAELGPGSADLRAPLAAAALRFLRNGPRHARADVCDSTHCAWFVADGPVPRWLRAVSAVNEPTVEADLSESEWTDARSSARERPGDADAWTADCGGEPVSPHFIWGGGDHRVTRCPRHAKGSGRVWNRTWPIEDLAVIFGAAPTAIDVKVLNGQWFLSVSVASVSVTRGSADSSKNSMTLTYDDVHRRLAQRLGWDAMPSPATRVVRRGQAFVAEGVGFGHRVGLCLGR